jgi:glycosyl transferase family 25
MNQWDNLFSTDYISINTYFDHIYYINLDKRIDRYESIKQQLKNYKINATRIRGIIPTQNNHKISNGQLGCLLSHLSILQDAQDKKYNKILIIEDDTIFKDNFEFLFNRFINHVPNNWDMLYLCGNHYGGTSYINNYVNKSNGTLTTNAYAINGKIIPKLLHILDKKIYDQPVDSIYCSNHKLLNVFVSVPNICYQMASFSDIENKITDYHILK